MTTTLTLRVLTSEEALARAEELAGVLCDCVEGGASVSFMLPFTTQKALQYWHGVAAGVGRKERTLIVAEDADGIVGTVQLITDMPDNQPHRADVAKLLVHRRARGAGVGHRLMEAVEREARAQGRNVLVLDTANGTAERLYERLGWQRVGVVPAYALLPAGGLCATTFYYKQLGESGNVKLRTDAALPGAHPDIFREAYMSDDLNKRGAPDRNLISLSEPHEVRYWTEALGISHDELKKVVGEVGNSAAAVRERLAQK